MFGILPSVMSVGSSLVKSGSNKKKAAVIGSAIGVILLTNYYTRRVQKSFDTDDKFIYIKEKTESVYTNKTVMKQCRKILEHTSDENIEKFDDFVVKLDKFMTYAIGCKGKDVELKAEDHTILYTLSLEIRSAVEALMSSETAKERASIGIAYKKINKNYISNVIINITRRLIKMKEITTEVVDYVDQNDQKEDESDSD